MPRKQTWSLSADGTLHQPPSREAERLAKRINKKLNTAMWYDYYWLVGEIFEFELKCKKKKRKTHRIWGKDDV